MSRKRPAEPSMNLIRRLGDLDPAKLAGEVQKLRRERDALRDSLSMKLSAHIRTLDLQKGDVLLVQKPGPLDPKLAAEVLDGLSTRLRQRYGWEGAIILLDGGSEVRAVTPDEAEDLLEKLRGRSES